jgi:hypothetical protein
VRIKTTDTRERLWEQLRNATDHQHTSQALDAAARYYVRMYGDSPAQPTGVVDELLNAARAADGGLDEQDIAEILDTPELGVDVEVTHRRSTTPAAATDE